MCDSVAFEMEVRKGYHSHKSDACSLYPKQLSRLAKKGPQPRVNIQLEATEELPFQAESCTAEGFLGGSWWSTVTIGSSSVQVAKGLVAFLHFRLCKSDAVPRPLA